MPATTGTYVIDQLHPGYVTVSAVADLNALIKQLSRNATPLTPERLRQLLEQRGVTIFVARDTTTGQIVGTSTLTVSQQLVGGKAWLEDVVVLESHPGQGLGRLLTIAVIMLAARLNVKKLDLTSSRDGAVQLYEQLGWSDRGSRLMRHADPAGFDASAMVGASIIRLP